MHYRTNRYRTLFAAAALLLGSGQAQAGGFSEIPSYYKDLSFDLTSPSAYVTAVGGYANPAVYAMMPGSEIEAYFSDPKQDLVSGLNQWGLFTGLQHLGFGFQHQRAPGPDGTVSVTDYRLALSGGTKDITFGLGVGWSGGDTDTFGRTTIMQLGLVRRFGRYVSLGVSGDFSTETSDQAGLFDLAVRPMGDGRLTLFGDLQYPKGYSFKDSPWSAGAMLEVPAGVRFIGRYYEDESFSIALAYTFGAGTEGGIVRGSAQPFYDKDANHTGTNWGVRMGYRQANGLWSGYQRDSRYAKMQLRGPVKHTRFKYFDRSLTLSGILDALEGVRTDDRVAGVAINLSGLAVSRGNAWEIREKLSELQRDGKHVVVFIDQAGMTLYHLASVADRIVMDPEGYMILPGYSMSRTYLSELAKKLGLGVEEFRFKEYKSAMESLTRRNMSPADREQRQALVDEYYRTMRDDVAASRDVDGSTVDEWIDDITIMLAPTAVEQGLVDQLGRWEDAGKIVKEFEGSGKRFVGKDALAKFAYPSESWGEPPRIAVVYAIGVCAMDTGIRARELSGIIRRLSRDRLVKAVVLRVNSPGGSSTASDVVAGALRECAKRKPVIVSQGDVAASGGYWISMYGDEIIAQPMTITGSIGVIGGWVWDDGIGEKMGLDSDYVKKGKHADAFVQLKFPFLPLSVPERQLTEVEKSHVLGVMEGIYGSFVTNVSAGRKMDPADVEKVAKGRVWTGAQGVQIGLIDRIGGLERAIAVAREKAGIKPDDEVKIVEYGGEKSWLDMVLAGPRTALGSLVDFGSAAPEVEDDLAFLYNYDMVYLEELCRNNGRPRCMLPPEFMPREEEPVDY